MVCLTYLENGDLERAIKDPNKKSFTNEKIENPAAPCPGIEAHSYCSARCKL